MTKTRVKEYLQHHKGGTLMAKGQVVGQLATGYWQWFRKDGTIKRSGYFQDGIQVSKWTTYDSQGEIYKITDFKEGDATSPKTLINCDA